MNIQLADQIDDIADILRREAGLSAVETDTAMSAVDTVLRDALSEAPPASVVMPQQLPAGPLGDLLVDRIRVIAGILRSDHMSAVRLGDTVARISTVIAASLTQEPPEQH